MASKPQSSQSLSNLGTKIKEVPSFFKHIPASLKDPRKRWWVIVPSLVVLAVIVAGAYYQFGYLPAHRRTSRVNFGGGQVSVARRGTITLSAIGTGTLQPANEVQLGFGGNTTNGKLVTLNVKVSDQVKAGQLLAEIDNSAAKINYEQAQQDLVNLTSPAAIATAEQDIAAAKATLYTGHE